jgi:DNA-binding transcriptional MocR family regulator
LTEPAWYFRLAQHFERAIRPGALTVGSRLGNEVQLAGRRGLSRPTVRAAFQYLSNKGLVVRKRGAGTLAANERTGRDVELTSLYDDLAAAGRSPDTKVIRNEVTHAVRGQVLLARRHRRRPRAGRRARRPGWPGHRRRPGHLPRLAAVRRRRPGAVPWAGQAPARAGCVGVPFPMTFISSMMLSLVVLFWEMTGMTSASDPGGEHERDNG